MLTKHDLVDVLQTSLLKTLLVTASPVAQQRVLIPSQLAVSVGEDKNIASVHMPQHHKPLSVQVVHGLQNLTAKEGDLIL